MTHLHTELDRFLEAVHRLTGEEAPRFTEDQRRRALFADFVKKTRKARVRRFSDLNVFTKRPAAFTSFAEEVAGPDAKEAQNLISKAQASGTDVLVDITRKALKRALKAKGLFGVIGGSFFNDDELLELTEALTETNVAANLLGRSQVRTKMYDEDATFEAFNEAASRVRPMRAIEFFSRLVPMVGASPEQFIDQQRVVGFTMARVTSESVLRQVQRAILRRLATGEDFVGGPREIEGILEGAGIHPRNPTYPDAIFRTWIMRSYTTGLDEERMRPDVVDAFPVWRWLSIPDERRRKKHRELHGRYFPAMVSFDTVRGSKFEDFMQCRCLPQLVSLGRWRRLRASGAKIAEGYIDPVPVAA